MESSSLLIAASQIIESLSDRVIERLKTFLMGCQGFNRKITRLPDDSIPQ